MTRGAAVSARADAWPTMALVIATAAALGLLGCRVTLRFDDPEAGADARRAELSCASDQECASPLPRCDPTTGTCVGCLARSDCGANQFCDPDDSSCRALNL